MRHMGCHFLGRHANQSRDTIDRGHFKANYIPTLPPIKLKSASSASFEVVEATHLGVNTQSFFSESDIDRS
jgi:hypothetical protein